MTKNDLLALVKADHDKQEDFYLDCGPNKHAQEAHYQDGVSIVSRTN